MELTPELSTLSVLLLGFFLGLSHAIEADHLAAVSAIVSEKKNIFSAAIVGGLWGVGHTISLFVVGAIAIFLKLQISETAEAKLEAIVGGMLILLGLNALRKLFTAKEIHAHTHEHGARAHTHFHLHKDEESGEKSHHRFSPRSVLIGMVHGLAGSAALTIAVVPTIKSPIVALAYIFIFGVGSIGGMMLMSLLLGLPFHFTANNFVVLNKAIRLAAGIFSFGLGMFIVYEKLLQT
ncbi:MAG: urease accessory protein UreH [Acidobacteria bacterium]|jgi:sulfite exporter TauE/SafE|nr:urease accessory protein UreH [Acidobacteriota bacterium]